jgi:hypothetical protein
MVQIDQKLDFSNSCWFSSFFWNGSCDFHSWDTVKAGDLGQISTLTLDCGAMQYCILLQLVLFY